MALPKDSFQMNIQEKIQENWRQMVQHMEESLDLLDKGITEAAEMRGICTDEWCVATEHVLDDLSNSLFSISEPHWSSEADTKKIKMLKRRLHDLYATYKVVGKR